MMLGDIAGGILQASPHPWMVWALFFGFTLTVSIVLLNLLIALLGDSVDRVQERQLPSWRYERAQVIVEIENLMRQDQLRDPSLLTSWLLVAVMQLPAGAEVRDLWAHVDSQRYRSDWEGRLSAVNKSVAAIERKRSRQQDAMEARLAARSADQDACAADSVDQALAGARRAGQPRRQAGVGGRSASDELVRESRGRLQRR